MLFQVTHVFHVAYRWLRSIPLKGETYLTCLEEVIAGIEAACAADDQAQKNNELTNFVAGFCKSNKVWATTMKKMGAK